MMKSTMKYIIYAVMFIAVAGLSGCKSAKLSTANEQYDRGEYFDASKTYRKVYNKLTKRELDRQFDRIK